MFALSGTCALLIGFVGILFNVGVVYSKYFRFAFDFDTMVVGIESFFKSF